MSSSEENVVLPKEDEVFLTPKGENYKIVKLLGKGGYGAVYEVIRQRDGKHLAIKCESAEMTKKVLQMDLDVMKGAEAIRSVHFCKVEDRAYIKDRFNMIVMKLINKNLWDLRVERKDMRFTLNTALKAATQSLLCIEELHRIGFLHRDIKPGNFAIGRPEAKENHVVFMLDFGLARRFMTDRKKDIRIPREQAPFRGTTRYAPLAAMMNHEQSRKDDIESWMYMVVEWTSGALPWRKYKANNRKEVEKMKQQLKDRDESMLDEFYAHCPRKEFDRILQYLHSINYFNIPDYKYVLYAIEHAQKANGFKHSDPVDWDENNPYTGPAGPIGDGEPLESIPAGADKEKAGRTKDIKEAKEVGANKVNKLSPSKMS
ncbi:hypothetical protein WR25_15464 [Diploscapter pachys]|uniref:Protein kinase domain-containing protein n=1 Tax=Diploscapter pachys TaxID=2018661 RepID=A0A2A2KXR7_9BILA|nr:hypothetical protein WR25_15464 [Diploscapter pachys]